MRGYPPRYDVHDAPGIHREGQIAPHKLCSVTWLRSLPDWASQFPTVVPGAFWTLVDEDCCEVACPCGETPRIRVANVALCQGEGCGRAFWFLGASVRVGRFDAEDVAAALLDEPATPV